MNRNTRRWVILGLLIAQAATLLVLFLVSGRVAATAESDHQDALLATKTAEAIDRMRAHLQPAESVVTLMSNALAEGELGEATVTRTFIAAMETTDHLDGVFVGRPDGSFLYVSRTVEGYRIKNITKGGGLSTTELTTVDDDGTPQGTEFDPTDSYDPRTRPWYQQAAAMDGGLGWTDPYVFFTSQQLGLTATAPIVQDGVLVGVVGADIELGSLSTFLTSLDSGVDGSAVIVNQDGVVIAYPDSSLLQRETDDGYRTVTISEFEDERARAAVGAFVIEGASEGPFVAAFTNEQIGSSRASFRTVAVGDGDWTVAVFGPEDSLVGGLASARAAERTLLAVAGGIAFLLVAFLAARATRPLDELDRHAWSDMLTGIPNRRSILLSAERDVARAEGPGSLAIIDVDNFKQINDTYGHQVGDEVLAEIVTRAETSLPDGAAVGRIGGEEFLVVLPRQDPERARQACEDMRALVRSAPIEASVGKIEATISVGLANTPGPTGRDHLMAVADLALLEAKSSGRDRVVVAGTSAEKSLGGR